MTALFAVDPGLRYPAGALFINDVLVRASRVPIPKGITTKTPIMERCRAISRALLDYAGCTPDELVVEYPQIYTRDKSKGDPNNLVPLAVIGGCLSAMLPNARVISPQPREWTGNIPKTEEGNPWDSPRGRRIHSRLTAAEIATVTASHDAVDAIGIGLFALGRFERRRVYDSGI